MQASKVCVYCMCMRGRVRETVKWAWLRSMFKLKSAERAGTITEKEIV